MKLATLIEAIGPLEVRGGTSGEITSLTYSTGAVTPGALHFCIPGFTADGHDFAADAVRRGAAALVVEHPLDLGLPQLLVPSSRTAMAVAADVFFGRPSDGLAVV